MLSQMSKILEISTRDFVGSRKPAINFLKVSFVRVDVSLRKKDNDYKPFFLLLCGSVCVFSCLI